MDLKIIRQICPIRPEWSQLPRDATHKGCALLNQFQSAQIVLGPFNLVLYHDGKRAHWKSIGCAVYGYCNRPPDFVQVAVMRSHRTRAAETVFFQCGDKFPDGE